MPFMEMPGWRMYYEVAGTGPQTIVAIHGNIASVRWWKFLLPYIQQDYRIIMMDLRGCGRSSHTKDGYDIFQFTQDIQALVEHLQVRKFHLLGHSMGGQIAMAYALDHQEQVRTLTLVDSVPADGLPLTEEIRQGFRELQSNDQALKEAVRNCVPYCEDREFVEAIWRDACSCAPEIYFSNPETMHATKLIDHLGLLYVPILVIHGWEDVIIPVMMIFNTVRALQSPRLMILEKCGHSPFVERPELAAATFIGFLKDYRMSV